MAANALNTVTTKRRHQSDGLQCQVQSEGNCLKFDRYHRLTVRGHVEAVIVHWPMVIRVTLDPYSNIERRVLFMQGEAILGYHSACDWLPGTPGPDRSSGHTPPEVGGPANRPPIGVRGARSSPPGYCSQAPIRHCPEPAVHPAARSAEATIYTGSIIFSINQFSTSWGPTDKKSLKHTDKISFLHAKHSLKKPPHAFGSHKDRKSATVPQY